MNHTPKSAPARRQRALLLPMVVSLACSVSVGPPARAASLQIRARSALDVAAHRGADGIDIAGHLGSDDERSIERATLHVHVDGAHPRTVATDTRGAFGVRVPLPKDESGIRSIRWQLRYDGDTEHGSAGAAGVVELGRKPTRVDVEVTPQRTTLDGEDVRITVWVRVADGSIGISNATVALQLGLGPARVARTGRNGQVSLSLHPSDIGSIGEFPVRATYPGDDAHMPSLGEAALAVLRPTRINLTVGREGDLETGRYRFSGRLVDDAGPVSNATIALIPGPPLSANSVGLDARTRPIGLAVTNERGTYVTAVSTRRLASIFGDSLSVSVRYGPPDERHVGATSASARIALPGPEGVPIDWYLSCTAVLLGLLLLGHTLRSGAWQPLAWWRRITAAGTNHGDPTLGKGHSVVLTPARGEGLRHHWVGGTIVDMDTCRPVPKARLFLFGPGAREMAVAGPHFEAGPLEDGEWEVELQAPAYLSRRMAFTAPHEGHLDGATYGLLSIRGHVRDVFAAAIRRSGLAFRWGWDTPSEVLERAQPPSAPALGPLKEHVEQVWFADRESTPADAERANDLAAGVLDKEGP